MSSFDPCLLVSIPGSTSIGIVGMQTDDTIGLSDHRFNKEEDEELQKAAFAAKPKQRLDAKQPLIFNGGIVSIMDNKVANQSTAISIVDNKASNQSTATRYDPVTADWSDQGTTNCLVLRQKDQGKSIKLIDQHEQDYKQQYVEQRARGAYIASICQPEACFDLSVAAQIQEPDAAAVRALNKRLL